LPLIESVSLAKREQKKTPSMVLDKIPLKALTGRLSRKVRRADGRVLADTGPQ
jgi:hypothetical protein